MQYSYLGLGNKMTTKEAGIKAKSAETSKKAASSAKGAPLTEAELRKMSDKDYMSAAQLEFFRTKLQTLKEDILKHASETTEHLRENILGPDPAYRATICHLYQSDAADDLTRLGCGDGVVSKTKKNKTDTKN